MRWGCCSGLQSKSLEHLTLINTSMDVIMALTGPTCPPNLASILVQQTGHGQRSVADADIARM
jgi:hypothetical protein